MKFGVHMLYFNQDKWILKTIENCAPFVDKIYIGERIRDIIYDFNKNVYYIYLEDTPKIMRLSNLN